MELDAWKRRCTIMNKFEYTVTTNKSFPEAVEAVEKKAAEAH